MLSIVLAKGGLFTLPADTEQQYHPVGVFLSPDQLTEPETKCT